MELLLVFAFLVTALSAGASQQEVDQMGDEIRREAQIETKTSKDVPDARPKPCRYIDGSPIQRDLSVPREPIAPSERKPEYPHVFTDE